MKKLFLLLMNISMFIVIFKLNPFLALPLSYDKFLIAALLLISFFFSKGSKIRSFNRNLLFLLLMLVYGVIISLNYNYEINHQVYRFFLFIFESLTLSYLVLISYEKIIKKDRLYLFKVIFYCILIQSILIVLSFIFPPLYNTLNLIAPLEGTNFDDEISFRIFRGLSNTSGSAHSVVLSLGALIALYLYAIEKKKIYLGALIFVFLATAINGRTGVILLTLYVLIYIVQNIKREKIIKPLLIGFFILFISQSFVSYFFSFNSNNQEIKSWYDEAFSFLDNKSGTGFYNTFGNEHLFLPNTWIELIFGSGYDTDMYLSGKGSDSGIVKNIFSFGVILTVIFYVLLCLKIYKSGQNISSVENYFSVCIIAVLLISEIKEPFLVKTFLAKLVFIVVISRNMKTKNIITF